MKTILLLLGALVITARLHAQNNVPVRLAIVPETAEVGTVADMLTAEFSKNDQVHLLERAEIERVYREQGLSAANRDDLKLGQILGADGLLLLGMSGEGANQFLNVRLVAVKPGAVLVGERFSWPMKDLIEWAPSFEKHLDAFLPKLAVLAKDAIPISVVNLRSAIQSDEGIETERQLKLLTIQRLSQERQLFILERQRMERLSEEKVLKSDESPFWDGSYLLEGVVDQNGYSPTTMTINARLTPPKGGTPIQFVVSGGRTNLSEVVNQLALKVNETLKVSSTVKEWNAADEAQQYFEEANWALKWGVYSEAQAAAESAWALGKRDLACAKVRVSAYNNALPEVVPADMAKSSSQPGYRFVHVNDSPDPRDCDVAICALQDYCAFSRSSPDGEPKVLSRGPGWNDWHDSDWYRLGVATLAAASQVLWHYNVNPQSQPPVAGKLADLRSLARSAAGLISQSPSVHDSYFVDDRIATRDELSHCLEENPNIFRCEVKWGCFWQETPEDCIKLYRELMRSPAFFYIHDDFWSREWGTPRVVAWNDADRERVSSVWGNFMRELDSSTNVLLRMESKALAKADAKNKEQAQAADAAWWSIVRSNREELVANNVELFYLGWKFAYNPETQAMDQEYWNKTVPALRMLTVFKKQKQYLANLAPYDPVAFNRLFSQRAYTKAQAAELEPLIVAYKSNLIAQASEREKSGAKANVRWIEISVERDVAKILNPPPVQPPAQPQIQSPPAAPLTKTAAGAPVRTSALELATNVITVNRFLPIPLEGLPGDQISHVTVTAHHWAEGKLLLDFQYSAAFYSFGKDGNQTGARNATLPAIALLDPATEHWEVVSCPEVGIGNQTRFYHHTTLWRGEIYTSNGGHIGRFDEAKKVWEVLKIPDVGNCELFAVNNHLYAATPNLIVEILDGGAHTRILASNRRQPPVSSLDTESLGIPALFAGPGEALRAAVGNKIVVWSNDDWRPVCPAPRASKPPVISDDGVLFLSDGWNAPAGVWRLAAESDRVAYCLGQQDEVRSGVSAPTPERDSGPLWKLPRGFSLSQLSVASRGPDLYLMADHARPQDIVDEQRHLMVGRRILPQNAYHAELLCFASNYLEPQTVFLKFEREDAELPVTGDQAPAGFRIPNSRSSWILFSSNYLFCGRETFDALPSAVRDPSFHETQTGVWLVSLGRVDSEIARQRKTQMEARARADTLATQTAQALLEKYDRNHDGVISLTEREDALDDPLFIKFDLDKIDANHNGILDPEELVYFDANQNQILDPKEQTGIDIAQHLLAERLLTEYDANEDASLGLYEFTNLRKSLGIDSGFAPEGDPTFPRADKNHDRAIDLGELEAFLKQQTLERLQPRPMPGQSPFLPGRPPFSRPMGNDSSSNPQQLFKSAVEWFWKKPGSVTNQPPQVQRMEPFNRGPNP